MAVAICSLNMTATFDSAQKQYLEGFFTGVNQRPGMPFLGQNAGGQFTDEPTESVEQTVHGTPIDELCKEETIKHERNGLDVWDQMFANAEANQFPEADDMFRYKFLGLFHVKPAQDSFMLRTRVAGCALTAYQFSGLADIAENFGGGYLDLTTRGNTQVREIMPKNTIATLTALDVRSRARSSFMTQAAACIQLHVAYGDMVYHHVCGVSGPAT